MNDICSLNKFFETLDNLAPLSLSKKMIEMGDYDNSGILIKTHDYVKKALFSLDLSSATIKRAKRIGADTIVTHHPAIYNPILTLDTESVQSADVAMATSLKLNVISMHLNLDVADGGIDFSLAEGLGAKDQEVLEIVDGAYGYGRVFDVKEQSFSQFVNDVKSVFNTKKVISYGSKSSKISRVASFCGGGASHAVTANEKGLDADVVVTSDLSHHHVKALIEGGKRLVILPHYASEEYGFRKYYNKIKDKLSSVVELDYFDDRRFR